jgi:hypothetical protein
VIGSDREIDIRGGETVGAHAVEVEAGRRAGCTAGKELESCVWQGRSQPARVIGSEHLKDEISGEGPEIYDAPERRGNGKPLRVQHQNGLAVKARLVSKQTKACEH